MLYLNAEIMDVPCEMLLHPELMSNEQLKVIIRERHLNVPNLESMRREELLEIFHSYCVPYGQRKYRDSGRGKVLNKSRKPSPAPSNKLNTFNGTLHRKSLNSEKNERIKPPPDLLSVHLKRIKLDINKHLLTDNNTKRKAPLDHPTQSTEVPPVKKGRKPITWP